MKWAIPKIHETMEHTHRDSNQSWNHSKSNLPQNKEPFQANQPQRPNINCPEVKKKKSVKLTGDEAEREVSFQNIAAAREELSWKASP